MGWTSYQASYYKNGKVVKMTKLIASKFLAKEKPTQTHHKP